MPDSSNLREMWGAKAAALERMGQSTRRTIRQNPPTVASHDIGTLRDDAVEWDDRGLEEGRLAGG